MKTHDMQPFEMIYNFFEKFFSGPFLLTKQMFNVKLNVLLISGEKKCC